MMDMITQTLMIFVPFLVLMFMGMPVAFIFIMIMMGLSNIIAGPAGTNMTLMGMFTNIATFSFAPIPLFVMMGSALSQCGLARRSLDAVGKLVGKVPARLSILATIGGAFFGMLSGSTMVSTAVLGNMLGPEMRMRNYSKSMTYGSILASGSLDMIIPPSALAVIYATTAQISVGRILIAGFIPGFLMAAAFCIYILLRVKFKPSEAPDYDPTPVPRREKIISFFRDLFPAAIIIFLVTGVFILGIATPTEAAALGALGTMVIGFFYKTMTWKVLIKILKDTVISSTMILLIIGGSCVFSQLLSYTGFTQFAIGGLSTLSSSPYVMLCVMIGIVLVMGCFMESVPIIMLTTPIFVPVANALGFDPIWFGIIMLICIQMGLTTPPFGMLLFVMKNVAGRDATMKDISLAGLPFLLCDAVIVLLIIFLPSIITYIPSLLIK